MLEDDAPPPPPPDEGGSASRTSPNGPPVCDRCGSPMLEVHCKIACPVCGYLRDCSDPFRT